jgi:hypothetical protein
MDDRDYLSHRAEVELHMAQTATAPAAVKAHYQLAALYLDRLYGKAEQTAETTRA